MTKHLNYAMMNKHLLYIAILIINIKPASAASGFIPGKSHILRHYK